MPNKLRVGIIGVGGIATHAHIPGYRQLLDRVELVACADVNAERAREVAARFEFRAAYADYREMLEKEALDAVSVCTPNKFHAPASIAALEAGCHVLCEKPPALTAAEAEAMVAAAEKAKRVLTFGLHMRFTAEAQAAKRLVDGGEMGDIYAVRVNALRRRGIPGWGVFTNKELQGGGPLIDIGVHMLDLALYLMGYPVPRQVFGATFQKIGTRPGVGAMGEWNWRDFQVEDLAMGMIRFANGAAILLETSFAAEIEPMEEMSIRLSGTQGGLSLFPLKVFKESHGTLYNLTPAWLPRVERPHGEEVKHFVDACLNGGPPMVKGYEAIRLQQILEAIYRSAESGELVTIPESSRA
ncbi:MAG TPA: Gfo/Idh/MocA family oxidoreductase [Limnochordia bacterium]